MQWLPFHLGQQNSRYLPISSLKMTFTVLQNQIGLLLMLIYLLFLSISIMEMFSLSKQLKKIM